ncbi:hypothetical protein AeRB84_013497 [Aphanomyces euteiches]|nr:hypothetical protein AeRB84_013497 [Aphanomyces euteiches]
MACVADYWKVVVPTKSTAELNAEDWLFVLPSFGSTEFVYLRTVAFTRLRLLFVSLVAHFCIGSFLAFVTLDDALDMYFYERPTGQTRTTMLLSFVVFGLSAAVSGPFIERHSPRLGTGIGTAFVGVGYVLSQLSVSFHVETLLPISFAFFCGTGFGIVLVAQVCAIQKWFPDFRGAISGLCMFSLGLGYTGVSLLYTAALHRKGPYDPVTDVSSVPHVFWATGIVVVPLLILSWTVIRTPPLNYAVNGQDIHCIPVSKGPNPDLIQDEYLKVDDDGEMTDEKYFAQVKAMSLAQCIVSSDFVFLYVAFAANSLPGLIFATEVYDLATGCFGASSETTNKLVLQGFLANSIGRLVCPLVSDIFIRVFYWNPAFSRKAMFVGIMTMQLAMLALLARQEMTFETFRWMLCVIVFGTGGGFALLPCFVTDIFGVYHAGTMYGLAMTCWSIRAVVAGYALDTFELTRTSMASQFQWMLVLTAVGWLAIFFVRTTASSMAIN